MLNVLGAQKVFLLLVLVAAVIILFFFNNFYIMPLTEKLDKEVRINEVATAEVARKIDTLVNNHDRFLDQKKRYDFIEQTDFFNSQNRLEVRQLISELKEKSRLVSVKFSMGELTVEANEQAQEVEHKLLKTDVEFDVNAIEDTDIYNFVFMLNYGFPGMLEIQELELMRPTKLTQPLLRQIGAGEPVSLVRAKLKTVWWTLVPSNAVNVDAPSMEEGY